MGAAADVAAPGAGGVVARANVRHDVIVRVRLPHAETVDWQLTCPGATASGTLGETMDAYRTRRIGELRAERDRERRAMANVGAAVGNAVLPPQTVTTTTYTPGASATVATPLGTATVVAPATTTTTTTRVDGATVGAMAGAAVVSDEIVLAPDDVGGGTYTDRATVFPTGDGACVVTVT
ncbi:MAG TPA: hypothetical protein VL463_00845, partial [Kofleriaceae bacterium]|nr:hypothetical protein [Kofleriaceae bacterium]